MDVGDIRRAIKKEAQEETNIWSTPDVPQPEEVFPRIVTRRRHGFSEEQAIQELRSYGARRYSPWPETVAGVLLNTLQPLIKCFRRRMETEYVSEQEIEASMLDLFREIISTTSDEIFEAVMDTLTQEQRSPSAILVSRDEVKGALCPLFKACFRSRSAQVHEAIESVLELISCEVTNTVNSELSCSSVCKSKDYTTSRYKLQTIIHNAKKFMLSSRPCGEPVSPEESSCFPSTIQDRVKSRKSQVLNISGEPIGDAAEEDTTTLKEVKTASSPKPVDIEDQERAKHLRIRDEHKWNGLSLGQSVQSSTPLQEPTLASLKPVKTFLHIQFEWEKVHIEGLAYKLICRVLQVRSLPAKHWLYIDLCQQLESHMREWTVKVRPDTKHIKDVAEAVYRDLRSGYLKEWVQFEALIGENFMTRAMDTIHKHLEMPPRKRSKLSSIFHLACCVFCWPCRQR